MGEISGRQRFRVWPWTKELFLRAPYTIPIAHLDKQGGASAGERRRGDVGGRVLANANKTWIRPLAGILVLTAVYAACGKFGLSLAFVNASASAVWPPTGVALAALLVLGYRLWPGVFLGAFFVNVTTVGSLATAAAVAGGNTCEALLGAWLVNKFAGGAKVFERTSTFLRFVLLAGILSTMVSATAGVTSVCAGGFADWSQYPAIWLTWWSGDMVSNLIIAPLLVIWFSQGFTRLRPVRFLECACLLVTLVLVGLLVFVWEGRPSGLARYPWSYLSLLPLVWAALRFGERGAVTAAFLMDGLAIAGTLRGWGPFASQNPNESLLFLQVFIGTAALMAVALALALSERKRAEQLLAVECAISRQLGEASTLDDTVKRTLARIGSNLPGCPWDAAAFWTVDALGGVLRCNHTWHAAGAGVSEFQEASRGIVLAPGISLPGRVWADGTPAWIPDLQTVPTNCPRASFAQKAGFHSGCAFPVRGRKDCVGVIEVYSHQIRRPDPEMIRVFLALGAQLGQFIESKATEERLALVIEGSSDGIWDWDLAADEVYFSSRWKNMLGYAEDEVKPHYSAWDQLLHPEDRERAHASVRAYLAGQTSSYELEHRLRHKDGTYRWILSRGVALRDSTGKPVRMAGSHVDVTAHKQAEEQLRRAYAELSENEAALKTTLHKLQTANAELQTAQLQLIQAAKLESLGTLAAGVAHEVKNPLQTILMGVHYLNNNLHEGNGNIAQVLGDMYEAVSRANNIIREMLQLSAAADFEPTEMDLNPVVERSLWLINNEVIASKITVMRQLQPDLPRVGLDRSKMEQVLINLFLNAVQAMSQGGVLSVTTRHCRFGPELKMSGPAFARFKPGEEVVIAEVQDTGEGIPEANLAKIFDPFFSTKPTGVGTGLGLSVVKKIMDFHGGAIDVRNSPSRGVIVTLLLRAEPDKRL